MLSGTIQAAIGASHDLSFEVDYPEVPLLLYAGDHDCHPHCILIASLIAC